MEKRKYIELKDLDVYKLARELIRIAWDVYKELTWEGKKAGGDQFIDSTDSIGANIAEGYSRFHYLDKIKFYYNSRGSLIEASRHWIELLFDRGFVKDEDHKLFKEIADKLSLKLNNFIKTTYQSKSNK